MNVVSLAIRPAAPLTYARIETMMRIAPAAIRMGLLFCDRY